jgi:iron complex outermembrane recepter protein
LIANFDVYFENWRAPQVATNLAGYGLSVNAGNAHIKGIEGQVQALLPAGFDLALNASYVDAKFIEDSAISGYPAGTQIPDTPKFSGSAVLQWKRNLANGSTVFSSLEDDYVGARTDLPFGVTATLLTMDQLLVHLPSYNLLNLRLGVKGKQDGGGRWSAALFVKNLTNKRVLIDPQPQVALQTAAYDRYVVNQPLTAGIDISYGW